MNDQTPSTRQAAEAQTRPPGTSRPSPVWELDSKSSRVENTVRVFEKCLGSVHEPHAIHLRYHDGRGRYVGLATPRYAQHIVATLNATAQMRDALQAFIDDSSFRSHEGPRDTPGYFTRIARAQAVIDSLPAIL